MEEIVMDSAANISVSIVSHGQAALVEHLLCDIEKHCGGQSIEIVLTLNLEETLPFSSDNFSFPLRIIRNMTPLGFAANHNQAFLLASGRYFCVMNPDIRLDRSPFNALIAGLEYPAAGLAVPLVLGPSGEHEDSARRFPTPFKIICKVFGGCRSGDYTIGDKLIFPDWAAGMFMLFPYEIFKKLGGFDQRYFLYYEDVDLCARLRLLGYEVVLCPGAQVIHHAHRSSHRNFKYFKWHLSSMLRFFCSPVYWRVQCRKWF